jgi:hypothetical protein
MEVANIVVERSLCRDMYDEHPGLAYFYVRSQRWLAIPHPVPFETAKAIAEAEWQRGRAAPGGEDDETYEEYDGQFSPERILLLSCDGQVIQCCEKGQWLQDFVPATEWVGLLAKAAELESEASFEAGWDNFSTAENLRTSATSIRRKVAIARANAVAARTGKDSIRGLSERVSLAMARVVTVSDGAGARDAWLLVKRAGRALGIRDYLARIERPPLMFEGEPVLLKSWQEGVTWATNFVSEGDADAD